MNGELNVVVIHAGAELYGSDRVVASTLLAFKNSEGVSPRLVVPSDGALVSRIHSHQIPVELVRFPVLRRQGGWRTLISTVSSAVISMPRMIQFLRRRRPQLVWINTLTLPWWVLAAKIAGVPSVVHVHEAEREETLWARRLLYGQLAIADRAVSIGAEATGAIEEAIGARAVGITQIPNPVPTPSLTCGASEPASSEAWRLGSVARLSHRKGTDILIAATAHLLRMGVDCELHLWGDVYEGNQAYMRALQDLISKNGLVDRVHFHGFTTDVAKAYASMDIFIAASRIEPFGISVVEAQLSKVPVVASAIGGHLESVEHGISGYLFERGDDVSLATAIMNVIRDRGAMRRIVGTAYHLASAKHSVSAFNGRVLNVAREVSL